MLESAECYRGSEVRTKAAELADGLSKQILVVEDEALIAADLQKRLCRLGYPTPVIAGSGEDALQCAHAAAFDLVLMDIHLTGRMDGIATAQALQQCRATPVVYLTALSDPETLHRAKLSGPFGYLVKPVREADLQSTVQISLYKAEMERRLIQSQRMEAVANLAGGLAHDFNNQLTLILGCAQELAARLADEDRARALEIQQAAATAASITAQLLTLSRHDLPRFETLNLNEVILEVQPLISRSLGKARTLSTSLGSPGWVRADRNQLKQVLLNLALNARDAMTGSGGLTIETATMEIDSGQPAQVPAPGAYVRLRVIDTGRGMDPATLARIFEPYITTKKPGLGTGLGLSVAHGIITQSGGYISATSRIGNGTSFEILLPFAGAVRAPGRAAAAGIPETRGTNHYHGDNTCACR
jgi:signal transduction histidine kinase